MSEISVQHPNKQPRRRRGVIAAATAGLAIAAGATVSAYGGNTTAGEKVTLPSIVKTAADGKSPLVLDCIDYLDEDGNPVHNPKRDGPRRLVFETPNGTIMAADIIVQYGRRVLNSRDNVVPSKSKIAIRDYWVAQDNTGDRKTVKYASNNDQRPGDWQDRLQTPYALTPEGTKLPIYGISPIGDGEQIVVARMSPYIEDKTLDGVLFDMGTMTVDCQKAEHNNLLPPDAQQALIPGSSDIATIKVPSSIVSQAPPPGNM